MSEGAQLPSEEGPEDVAAALPEPAPESDDLPEPDAVADQAPLPEPDARLIEAHDLALAALHEITPPDTIGAPAGHRAEADGVVSLLFETALPGYPGWYWTVSLAVVDGSEPTVLEAELLPGEGALLAPEWVPWSVRLKEYQAQQAAAAEAAAAERAVEEADDEDEDGEDFDESDDFDEDGSSILHSGDVDGVDIDELDDSAPDGEQPDDEGRPGTPPDGDEGEPGDAQSGEGESDDD